MSKFFEISIYTFIFHVLCYVLWLIFVVPAEGPTNVAALGSLVYLPHAGRVHLLFSLVGKPFQLF